jgi:hypothetical protein
VEPSRGTTYADEMHPPASRPTVENLDHANSYSNTEHRVGTTYADIMARLNSNNQSDHVPPKAEGMISLKQSSLKPDVPAFQKLEASQYVPCLLLLIIRWSTLNWTYSKGEGIR